MEVLISVISCNMYNLDTHPGLFLSLPRSILGKFYFSPNSDLAAATEESAG